MELFLSALGLAMIFEGLPYFSFPRQIKEWAKRVPTLSNGAVRSLGMAFIMIGLIVIYVGRRLF